MIIGELSYYKQKKKQIFLTSLLDVTLYAKEGVIKFLNSHVVDYNQEIVILYFVKLGKTV